MFVNQGKLEVVKQDMAGVNIDILGISELKLTGMGCHFLTGDLPNPGIEPGSPALSLHRSLPYGGEGACISQ